MALATLDGQRIFHDVVAMALTACLCDLAIPHTFLQTGNAGADEKRQNSYSRQGRRPISRWEEMSHRAPSTRVRGASEAVNPGFAFILYAKNVP